MVNIQCLDFLNPDCSLAPSGEMRDKGCLANDDEQVVEVGAGDVIGPFGFSPVDSTIVLAMTCLRN